MNILGISAFYHDSAACLVRGGEIVAAAEEERFTRKKHDCDFPQHAVNFCLSYTGLKIEDIDYVAFYEKPFIKFERLLETYLEYAPLGVASFLASMPVWIKEKLFLKKLIRKKLKYDGKILFVEHHESHAASAFYPSIFRQAAFLAIDAVGERTTTSFGIGCDNDLTILGELNFPHSLGLLYSAFTYFTGFKVNSDEYKVMGLAPYGQPRYVNLILDNLIDLKEDGSFKLNMAYFNYCVGFTMVNQRFERLFGKRPRKPDAGITQKDMDLASSVQAVTEEIVLRMARHVYSVTGMRNLCLGGGVALNCVANGKLLKKGPFKNIWIQPASGDDGGSLGAALAVWYRYLKNTRVIDNTKDSLKGSYLGPEYGRSEIKGYLDRNNIAYNELDREEMLDIVSEFIMQGKTIGWFQGRMEFGPRALGSRSIIADARLPHMQSILNQKIKFRESFRPFAPSILKEKVSEYFELDRESPYMLLVAGVKSYKRVGSFDKDFEGFNKLDSVSSDIPAVTHVDGSARIQTVARKDNELYYDLIDRFYKKTNCPVIINTSFNVMDEPIVCNFEDAYNCFMKTGIDYLVMDNFILSKEDQVKLPNLKSLARNRSVDSIALKKFAIAFAISLAVASIVFTSKGHAGAAYLFLCGAILFLIFMVINAKIVYPIYWLAAKFGSTIGRISNIFILSFLFHAFVLPVSLILKLFKKDILDIKIDKNVASYWKKREKNAWQPHYERQF